MAEKLALNEDRFFDPDPTVHRFLMRRVDETWTCESFRDQVASLLELLDAADLADSS